LAINNRRSEIEIVRDILNLTTKGAKKTQILYQTNLSYTQLRDYLSFLLEKKFVELHEDNSSRIYKVTEKGTELLQSIKTVIRHLSC
jgi:predicted transcriptional regulator